MSVSILFYSRTVRAGFTECINCKIINDIKCDLYYIFISRKSLHFFFCYKVKEVLNIYMCVYLYCKYCSYYICTYSCFLYFVHTYSFSYIFFYSILNLLAFSHFFPSARCYINCVVHRSGPYIKS